MNSHSAHGVFRVLAAAALFSTVCAKTAVFAEPSAGDDQTAAASQIRPHGGMMRFPDISATHIVFVYANDLWLVPREGGTAMPLASPPGAELMPRFSPDGKTIAFVGNYDGNHDLYTIPTSGGPAQRVTSHPASELLCDWTPDGKLLYATNGFAGLARQMQLYTVPPEGGLPTKLPVPYGANAAISPDGVWVAYTPHTIDFRTWKRYRGGMATDIWLFNLKTHESKKITDWEGTDTQPMWQGRTIYYLCDAGESHRLNIWSYDVGSEKRKQVTTFREFDVKWPSIGPGPTGGGEIVFQNGSALYRLDLATGQSVPVDVTIPGDRPRLRERAVNADKFITGWDISSTGKRAALEARGDVWTAPAKDGSPRNLTRTSGVAERDPAWSPDGKWIAYLSDESGEYELYVVESDGKKPAKRLTHDGAVFRYNPTWSPDSRMIAFSDKTAALFLHVVKTGDTTQIDQDGWDNPPQPKWSPDSRWMVYTKTGENRLSSIWLYDVKGKKAQAVTAGRFGDSSPVFDREGKYLYFASNRDFSSPMYEDVGTTFIYADTDVLLAMPLRANVKWPLSPKSDEESWAGKSKKEKDKKDGKEKGKEKKDRKHKKEEGKDKKDQKPPYKKREIGQAGTEAAQDDPPGHDGDEADKPTTSQSDDDQKDKGKEKKNKKDKGKDKKKPKPVKIDLEGMEARAFELPIERGTFGSLEVDFKNRLLYIRAPKRGVDAKPALKIFDPNAEKDEDKTEKSVADAVSGFRISADGKKLLVRKDDGKFAIVDAGPDQKLDKTVPTDGMTSWVDPREEWRQIFNEAWRLHRDYFYVPNMHGVNWPKIKQQYATMLDDCTSRDDVTYVIGEMISELNVGHAYVRGVGDVEGEPSMSVGMLGCDFELDDSAGNGHGAYRISKIYRGAPWDVDARGPLSEPGSRVAEGDYLLAVNRVPVDPSRDPWFALQGKADRPITLTISKQPEMDETAKDVVVKPIGSEVDLRYRAWVEDRRAYVDGKTDGKVGYIYVPNTGAQGQNELVRQFFGQVDKPVIVDERWNGGGQIPTRFIELLNRPIMNYWARRDGHDWPWPPDSNPNPKCMLINGLAGSGGDAFPWYFRQAKLGKLIGMRTWGGLVGISGNPGFIDSGNTNVPTFGFYKTNGTWGIEGHGVDPDIEVVDDPAKMWDGGDPQLDAAISLMLDEVKKHPYIAPKRPAAPDRSGMGVREEDR